ncbi:aminopeptidase N [Neisseria gonorrhoeae]|uniref:Aminopeptidase N n=1 Tax=Neisseria gonorrhoeae TaxID=485 RepID=A0A378VZK5_NEIGO|nr:aminopeptidase N [Neisseria gonorrhoeae]
MKQELQCIRAQEGLSKDVGEIVGKIWVEAVKQKNKGLYQISRYVTLEI